MLKSLHIKNFQSISDATLDFGKVTVITGPSNLGKSVVIRALETIIRNKYYSAYMKLGTSHLLLELEDTDGNKIRFLRGSSSEYELNGEQYTKIGGTIPLDIQNVLNMAPLQLDENLSIDLNFHRQFEPPFVLSNSIFEVSKIFGKMLNINLVQFTAKDMSRDLIVNQRKVDTINQTLDEDRRYVKENRSIIEQAEEIKALKESYDTYERSMQKQERLKDTISDLVKMDASVQLLQKEQELLNSISLPDVAKYKELLEIISILEGSEPELTKLQEELNILTTLETKLKDCLKANLVIKYLRTLEIVTTQSDFIAQADKFLENANKYLSISSVIEKGQILNEEYKSLFRERVEVTQILDAAQKEYDAYLASTNICPVTKKPYVAGCPMLEVQK